MTGTDDPKRRDRVVSAPAAGAAPVQRAQVRFEPLIESDLLLIASWLKEPHVLPWWHPDDLDSIAAAVRGADMTEPWLGLLADEPVAYFQAYDVAHDNDYAAACAALGVGPGSASLDYFIGPADRVGHGLGPVLISVFVESVVFPAHPDWERATASTARDNERSIRALCKAGFRVLGDILTADGPERLLVRDRPD